MKIVTKADTALAKMPLLYPTTRSARGAPQHRKIALPTHDGYCFEQVDQILYLTADGNYTQIYFKDGRQLLVCRTLAALEVSLNKYEQFVRVHRSHTINLHWLRRYVRGKGGYVILETGATVNISATRKEGFMKALESFF